MTQFDIRKAILGLSDLMDENTDIFEDADCSDCDRCDLGDFKYCPRADIERAIEKALMYLEKRV